MMDKMLRIITLLFCVYVTQGIAQTQDSKPRVVVMTDGEVDDHSSMIRFLLYTCDIDLLAIIETNSIFQRNGHSKEDWFEKQLEAYKNVYPNLMKHNPDYPTPEKLKSISFVGDEDIEHLKGLREKRWELIPGAKITYEPSNWKDTQGSNKIIELLLEDNKAPVYIQVWGGANTAARAFYRLKKDHPNDYKRALSKVVMYNIWYQDGAGNYIEQNFPEVTMIYCGAFEGTWNYRSQKDTYDFITNNVKNNHGTLGGLYPQGYVSEGDSPAFFYNINNGLRNHEHPTYGGWGGRFENISGFQKVYKDAVDGGDKRNSLKRWIDVVNNDFQARMDWCVAEKFNDANHPPIVSLKNSLNLLVTPGQKIKLNAERTMDPDGDTLSFNWWQYEEAGSYNGKIVISNSDNPKAFFTVPADAKKGATIHVICEVNDSGVPHLTGYQRVVLTIK
ncbi:DUF1593 domain-containing protein [Pedobacter alpinus]|uniref:Nucleoside hydrolase-like domain-containing protein n=1 Tax=Pedobacter alpinus TaxID=1590643 RepID=A0ABW5TRI6_9SPHI